MSRKYIAVLILGLCVIAYNTAAFLGWPSSLHRTQKAAVETAFPASARMSSPETTDSASGIESFIENYVNSYTLAEALDLVGTESGRADGGMLPLKGDFSDINPYEGPMLDSTDGKIIILWREGPEKEFEQQSNPFPENYEGKDIGEEQVYLCAALMEELPEERRARSLDEPYLILLAETRYRHSATIISQEDTSGTAKQPPSADEIDRLFSEDADADDISPSATFSPSSLIHKYRPAFTCCASVSLCDPESGAASFLGYETFPFHEMRDNPEADDLWEQILALAQLAANEDPSDGFVRLLTGNFSYLPEDEMSLLLEQILSGRTDEIAAHCTELIWQMAEKFKELDPAAKDAYDEAIRLSSFKALNHIVNRRSYASVSMSDFRIRSQKAYLGTPDMDRLEEMLKEAVEDFKREDSLQNNLNQNSSFETL